MTPLAYAIHAAAAERAAAEPVDVKQLAADRREERGKAHCRRAVEAARAYPPEETR